jgi:hypothetical protein
MFIKKKYDGHIDYNNVIYLNYSKKFYIRSEIKIL